ncbi:phage tail tape measure protein, partial [Atopobiaceae bacterium HCP3S3_A4]
MGDAVWIDVLPSMSKFADQLGKGADEAAGKSGKKAGGKFGLAMAAGVTAVAGGVVLAGKALYDLGSTFDDMTDTIRVGTGATGEALDGLVASAKNVGTKVPADFGDISTAVADINTRMGLTGPTLETFTGQVLEAGRLTGEAIDVKKVSASFAVFGIEGEKATGAMDTLYRVSQDTGVGMNELASIVQKAGPAVQALGFDFDQTAALVGGLDKAGLDASKMTAGLGKALVTLAKDGEEPQKAFSRTTTEIQNMLATGDTAGATELSAKLFGTKNAPQFMAALQQGKLNLNDLTAAATGSGDTIMQASADTASFSEQWQIFQNRMSVLVAPVAEKVFGLISDGMTWINDVAIPYLEDFFGGWSDGTGPLTAVQSVFDGLGAYLRDVLWPILKNVIGYVRDYVIPYWQKVAGIIADTVVPVLKDLWAMFNNKVLPILRAVADFIAKNVVPVFQDFANRVVLPLMKLVGQAIRGMWDNFAKPALNALWDFIQNYVGPVIKWLWDKVVSPTFKLMGDAVSGFAENWASIWSGLQAAAAKPVNFIIEVVWNQGLRRALNLIPGIDLAEARPIRVPSAGRPRAAMAGGGILPGTSRYADGDDQLVWMRRGEGVTVTEALDDYEKARLLRLNRAVLGGMSPARFRDQFDAHAGGGIVSYKGKRFTERFAAAIRAAEAMAGVGFNISQGGFRPRTSYSGTSHQGDALDMTPITTAIITALRASGIAAWDRTGKGNRAPHIHGV